MTGRFVSELGSMAARRLLNCSFCGRRGHTALTCQTLRAARRRRRRTLLRERAILMGLHAGQAPLPA